MKDEILVSVAPQGTSLSGSFLDPRPESSDVSGIRVLLRIRRHQRPRAACSADESRSVLLFCLEFWGLNESQE